MTLANRVKTLRHDAATQGTVLYVMSRDQRVHDNHALLQAQHLAGDSPVVVMFNLQAAGLRRREHYEFMLRGLREVESHLSALGIPFVLTLGDSVPNVVAVADSLGARSVVLDFNPLQQARDLALAERLRCGVHVVDTHNVIPAWVLSDKCEYAAHTIRRKVHRHLADFVHEPGVMRPQRLPDAPLGGYPGQITWAAADDYVATISPAGIAIEAPTGEAAARAHVQHFVDGEWSRGDDLLATLPGSGLTPLAAYAQYRNDPLAEAQSGLSPYLHFGQVSALRVALEVIKGAGRPPLLFEQARMAQSGEVPSRDDGMDALLEEMIVRKELSDNFCFYNTQYRSLAGTHPWAQQTLDEHAGDPREYRYDRADWESAATHDPAWNAAQRQLLTTGAIHGYMRMYWAKKMLEWSHSPAVALDDCIYLNDTYSVDGGDPNGYAGILWSIGGLHDRPWAEREVFGKIRFMNAAGLKRKFAVDAYVARWS